MKKCPSPPSCVRRIPYIYIHVGHTQQIFDRLAQLPPDADSDPAHAGDWPGWVHMRIVGGRLVAALVTPRLDTPPDVTPRTHTNNRWIDDQAELSRVWDLPNAPAAFLHSFAAPQIQVRISFLGPCRTPKHHVNSPNAHTKPIYRSTNQRHTSDSRSGRDSW